MPDTNPSVCYLVHPHPSLGTLTLSHGISASAWSRGISKPKKPTQGAPARAECPTLATKSAPSSAHSRPSGQNAQVSQCRTRPIAWPSQLHQRRDPIEPMIGCLIAASVFSHRLSSLRTHAHALPQKQSQTQQGLTKFRSKEHDLAVISSQSFQVQNLGVTPHAAIPRNRF